QRWFTSNHSYLLLVAQRFKLPIWWYHSELEDEYKRGGKDQQGRG
ncbi:hypothetical protein LINPERHAP1_LOCUS9026, partial [Linum perenne]